MPKQSPSSGPQIQPRPRRCQTRETSVRVDPLANEPWPPLFGLRDGLGELGYIEKQNLDLVYRFVEGQSGRYAALAGDLVRLPVDVTVTWGYACQPCCEGSEQWRFRLSPDLRV